MNPFDPRGDDFDIFINLTYWNIRQLPCSPALLHVIFVYLH